MRISFTLQRKGKRLILSRENYNRVKKRLGIQPDRSISDYSIQKNRKSLRLAESQERRKQIDKKGNLAYPIKSRYIIFTSDESKRLGLKEGRNIAVFRRSEKGDFVVRRRMFATDRREGRRIFKTTKTYTWNILLKDVNDSELLLAIRQDINALTRSKGTKDIFYVRLMFYMIHELLGEVFTPVFVSDVYSVHDWRKYNPDIVRELRNWLSRTMSELEGKQQDYWNIMLVAHSVTAGGRS